MKFLYKKSLSLSSTILLSLSVCNLLLCTVNALVELPPNGTVLAILVFGESIVDTGNNNHLETLLKCNFPPFGKDFMGGTPTGRCGNGRVASDLLAEELGIKQLVPSYLDPTMKPNDLITGVSFASGGAGFDPLTSKLVVDQLRLFIEYKRKLKKIVGVERSKYILDNTMFLVVAGSDDIANTYFLSDARKSQYDISSYTDFMAKSASSFYKKLYKLGARRILVFSAPPIGCLPIRRTLAGGLQRHCSKENNQAAKLFNTKLSSKLNSLNNDLPHAKMVYIDIYTPLHDLIKNYRNYGFKVANKGCCGTGYIEILGLCNQWSHTCPDASRYVFWDSYHPTEKAYKALLPMVFRKTY